LKDNNDEIFNFCRQLAARASPHITHKKPWKEFGAYEPREGVALRVARKTEREKEVKNWKEAGMG